MRVLASGDHHFVEGPRWIECLRVHDWIVGQVRERRPALFVSAGDVYDGPSTPVERAAVARFLLEVAEVCPVLVVRGNHDRRHDLELLAGLEARHRITVEEGAGVHVFGGRDPGSSGIAVGAFAWPSRASIATALGARSSEEVGQLGREALRRVFRGIGDRLRLEAEEGRRTLLVGHAQLAGCKVSDHGQPLPFGEQIVIGLEDLELANAEAVVLGHIHLAQEWPGPVFYTGSPFRNTFGEADPKSILELELEPGATTHTRIPSPAAPMVLLEGLSDLERLEELSPEERATAEVRLRYDVSADEREAMRARVARATAELEVGRLKVEERVRPVTRARSPEVAEARGLLNQLVAFWKTRPDLEATRLEALGQKLAELEEEVRS